LRYSIGPNSIGKLESKTSTAAARRNGRNDHDTHAKDGA
jgi:hypothetical protein